MRNPLVLVTPTLPHAPSRPAMERAAFVARLFDAGELELHEEALLLLDAPMGVWEPWAVDARSTLDGRGGAA